MKCGQPGCTGTIQDGYCDVCGMAQKPREEGSSVHRTSISESQGRAEKQTLLSAGGNPGGRRQFSAGSHPGPVRISASAAPGGGEPKGAERNSGSFYPGRYENQTVEHHSGPCPQPGCRGEIVDGYCNVCGNPPGAKLPGERSELLGTELSTTATASELGMVLIGSALVGAKTPRMSGRTDAHQTRTKIGAGVTTVPPAPTFDPVDAVLSNPVVPENRRFCPKCERPVGRGVDGRPGTAVGTCAECGTPYNYYPVIKPGELVAQQYEVAGAIAYGGMGWIYLAKDRNVNDRWVVLKGLLNNSDDDATIAAKSEKEFLAAVDCPLIVEIHNFVKHGNARYIVMEYVPGRSITDLLKERMAANKGNHDPLPVDWALAYLVEILPAFTYLHDRGLLYCDFKPDNLMQVRDSVKLIDLGAVRRINDQDSAIFGTVGYQAPEIADTGPTVASDIYTLGRSLMIMSSEFRGYQSEYVDTLQPLSKMPIFAENDSFYRLVKKACAPIPSDRFQSAEELRIQAMAVMREAVARRMPTAAVNLAPSALFGRPSATSEDLGWKHMPSLLPDPADPMTEWINSITLESPESRMAALKTAPQRTTQVMLTEIEVALSLEDHAAVARGINELLRADPWEWRAIWMQGISALQTQSWMAAQGPFNTVYSQVPGELAPKFALAVACERGEHPRLAEELFAICASTDAAYVTASAFAMSRIRLARGDQEGAVEALGLVPETSRGYSDARIAQARIMLRGAGDFNQLEEALNSIRAADLDQISSTRLELDVLERAFSLTTHRRGHVVPHFDGEPATARNLRPKLERAYLDLAAWTRDGDERRSLLAKADSIRRWSLI